MSNDVADYGADAFLNLLFSGVALPALYVALLTGEADKGFDGTILATEVEVLVTDPLLGATGYQRVVAPTWTLSDGGFVVSQDDMSFGTATADWGTVRNWALVDNSGVGGNLFLFGEFATPQFVPSGAEYIIPAGGLIVTLSGATSGIVV